MWSIFLPKVKIEVVCDDAVVERAVEASSIPPDWTHRRRQDLRLLGRGCDPHPHRQRGEDAV